MTNRIFNELIKSVIDDNQIHTVFPFPTDGGHHLLHELVSKYALFDVDNFKLMDHYKYGDVIENIRKGCALDKTNENGWSLLHYSCYYENIQITQLLVEEKADVNAKDNTGVTPLMILCRYNNKKVNDFVDVLLSYGADINMQDNIGWTALMYASSNFNTHTQLKYLLDKKANMEIENNNGDSVIQIASFYERSENIKILLEHNLKNSSN